MTARDPILIPADAAPDLAFRLADHAVAALVDEAMLTPKPGLVDLRGAGAHRDLSWPLMCASACALRPAFGQMALEGDSLTSRLPGKRAPVVAATGFKFTAPAAIATNYRSDRHGEAVAKVAEGNFMFVGMER